MTVSGYDDPANLSPLPWTSLSPEYRIALRRVYDLHQLLRRGQNESPEAEAIRDQSDQVWGKLTDAERRRLGEFSEDLYLLDESPSLSG